MLGIDGACVGFGGAAALTHVSLTIERGEIVALLGANGAGKSTLLRAVVGLVPLQEGTIAFEGQPIVALAAEARIRLGIGFAPEGRRVFGALSVRENLDVAAKGSRADRRRSAETIFALFPQLAAQVGRTAWQLSGGQQQMLSIGRALMQSPRLLLLDEPSLGLAPALARDVFLRIRAIANGGIAVLLAEQNAALALGIATRGYVLRLGEVAYSGSATALRSTPAIQDAFLGG
jgi:branched-chain amino acid transport system ATP-binding protein